MGTFRDKNHLLRNLKGDLGIFSTPLPFDDNEFYKLIIEDRALPEFSAYMPYMKVVIMDIYTDAVADREDPVNIDGDSVTINTLLRIPPILDQRILGVDYVRPHNRLSNLSMSSSFETVQNYQDLAQAQSLADLSSLMIPPMTFEYRPPDKIRLYNNHTYTSKLEVRVKYEHHKELFTIKDSLRPAFYQFALLTAESWFYANMRNYPGFRTAYGEVEIKAMDEWSGARDKKEELCKEWDETYHLDQTNIFYI